MKFLRRSERRDDPRDGHGADLAVDEDPDMHAIEQELQQLKSRKTPALPAPEPHSHDQALNDRHARDRHARDHQSHDRQSHDRHARDAEPLDLHDRHSHAVDHAHDDMVIDHEYHDEHDPHLPRTLKSKLFGIGFSGYFQLAVLCVFAGAVFEAGAINPFLPGFGVQSLVSGLGTGVLTVLNWALNFGLWPLVIGALVVLPLWLFWRLLTVPFRH